MSTPESSLHPLTEKDLANINDAIEKAKLGLQSIELAKRAGVDVTMQETQMRDALKRLQALKQTYFPNA